MTKLPEAPRRHAAAMAGLALALLAGTALGRTADWRSAAPPLPLDGAVRPAAAPVALGGAAWGPWRRICREQNADPRRPPRRDCLTVAARQEEAGATRLTLVQDGTGLRIGLRRDDEGRVTDFAALLPDGRPAPPDAARDGLLAAWRSQFDQLSLTRRVIRPRQDFPLPVPGSAQGGICRPEGQATLGGRGVLVARCAVELGGRLRGGESQARIAIFAHVALDVATGMVAAQGYATRIETFGGGGRSNGVVVTPSRVFLE